MNSSSNNMGSWESVEHDAKGAKSTTVQDVPNGDPIESIGRVDVPLLRGDLDQERALQQEQYDAATQLLQALGGILQGADETLTGLEDQADILPHAILRKCQEVADGIGHLATNLEEQSPEQQQALAKACAQDIQNLDEQIAAQHQFQNEFGNPEKNDLLLVEEDNQLSRGDEIWEPVTESSSCIDDNIDKTRSRSPQSSNVSSLTTSKPIATPTEEDFLVAIQGAASLLRDIEFAFREISENDAEDLADASLTLARLFLISIQNVYETLSPEDIVTATTAATAGSKSIGSVTIEELVDDNPDTRPSAGPSSSNQKRSTKKKASAKRMRVLWPRLGPEVAKALDWGKEAATQQPILAVVLGLTLWPAAIFTTLVGGSLVLADHALQDVYQHFQDGPLVSNMEQGAAQLFQAGKLGFLVSLVVGKQTLRVAQRQVNRHGGIEQIAHNVKDAAIDRAMHPIETVGMAWDGLAWGVSTVTDTVQQVLAQREAIFDAAGQEYDDE